MKKLLVEVWSDVACPWCWVGKRRLEAALRDFPHAADVEVVWRAFELDPGAPRVQPASAGTHAQRIARKYGMSVAQAEARSAQMTASAARDGITFRFDRLRSGNTFDAHRLIHFALERGKQDAMKERLLRAYFEEGEAIGDVDVLVRLAADVGLDADEARAALAGDAYAREVRADEARAAKLGISGVPFFVLGGRYAVSGAQPVELFREALAQAWEDAVEERAATYAEGAACGPEGC